MIEDRFNNIKIVITNNRRKIKLDLMKNQKSVVSDISSPLILLLLLENMDIKYNKKFILFSL